MLKATNLTFFVLKYGSMRKRDLLKKRKRKKKTLREIRKDNKTILKCDRHLYSEQSPEDDNLPPESDTVETNETVAEVHTELETENITTQNGIIDTTISSNGTASNADDSSIIEELEEADTHIESVETPIDNHNKKFFKPKAKKEKVKNIDQPKSKPLAIFFASLLTLIVIAGAIVGLFGGKLAWDMLKTKPTLNIEDLKSPNSSLILDKDGNVIMELGLYLRENIEYDDMPNCLVDAFLAIEDSRFFSHFGFDIPRFSMAIIENLKARDFSQGGSTITMQLIKNAYFQVDRAEDSTLADRDGLAGVRRKLQEIVLSIELNYKVSKKDTLALFVNKINFGNNIRGVEKAAQYYFNKHASELNLSESAFLAGIINSPNNYNPYNELHKHDPNYIYLNSEIEYLENATARRNEVLDLMVHHGYISLEEAELAKSIKMEDLLSGFGDEWNQTSDYYQSYIDATIDEVIETTGEDPYTVPMVIHTNMDPYMQKLVYDIQNDNTDIVFRLDTMQSAISIMNNQTGALIAIGGGHGQTESRMFNRATSAYIQPGSTVKPILEYALAFEHLGWATSHTITDQPIWLYNSNHLIQNAGGQAYTGDMLLTEAVARSLNTPAIQTLQAVIDEIGEEECVKYLNSIGFECDLEDFDLQFAIGGNRMVTTPVNLGAAHAVLMNEGYYIKPHTVDYIKYYDGRDNFVADTKGNQVLSKGAAYLAAYLEEYNVSGPYFNYMQILRSDYPVYAKTGTTDWGDSGLEYGIPRGGAKDSWLVAQTSDFTTTIWIGFDRADVGTYFTYYDDVYNAKGRIGRLVLDELESHLQYELHEIEQPDDVVSITHVRGLFPYAYPDRGTPVTGLILEKYAELVDADSIPRETKQGKLSGMGGEVQDDGNYTIHWYGFGSAGDGKMDISATNMFGKTEHAIGRCYYPRFNYINPSEYHARILVDGREVTKIKSSMPSYSGHLSSFSPGKSVQVCGWTSYGESEQCETIR